MKYHYTHGGRITDILDSGILLPSTIGFQKKREQAVWFSTNPFWEHTVGMYGYDHGVYKELSLEDAIRIAGGVYRIVVEDKVAPFDWRAYVKKSKTKGSIRRGMEATAKNRGANPSEWYVSFKPVVDTLWLDVETLDNGVWR